jgi:hypothetical protein
MNIDTNEKLVRRNARIAQVTMIGGLLVLAGGMYISFRVPEQFGLSMLALLLGFTLSQIGIYFSNRWGRRPRPDEQINQALKGLDSRYTVFHYKKPASHILVGPAGVWVLLPEHQRGRITFEKGRWRQHGGNLYMKIFAQESLGRPDLEVMADKENMARFITPLFEEGDKIPPVQAALVFTNPKVEIEVPEEAEAPAETVAIGKLKDLVRKKAKERSLSLDKVKEITQALEETR